MELMNLTNHMERKFLMGNEAVAYAAAASSVQFVSGYPGTPSTEILETIAKLNNSCGKPIHCEWSVNEKSAMEVAAGASYAGLRTMVTMKQVGLNVASDPLMSLVYVGVKGGMVIVVADDPGPISSQTEQDTRSFASFAKLPVFDPSTPEEAYEMVIKAYVLSERIGRPCLLRPTTRVCHACADVNVSTELFQDLRQGSFTRGPERVIFPKLSYKSHMQIEQTAPIIGNEFSNDTTLNFVAHANADLSNAKVISGVGIVSGGVSYGYTLEALQLLNIDVPVLKIGTPYPFPETASLEFMRDKKNVLVIEELDPVIERALHEICGIEKCQVNILGKRKGFTPHAGELSTEKAMEAIVKAFDIYADDAYSADAMNAVDATNATTDVDSTECPALPVRPPVLCAGCPHRASFYAVKKAMASMKGRKGVFSGDIGCYTLGNAMPLNMVDTCLCMGAGITVAQGLHAAEKDTVNFAFIGDSTFFHTGIAGVINAVYNKHEIVIVVLDNSTTAMTGHQPHPGTGRDVMGEIASRIDIEGVLRALGVSYIRKCNPFDFDEATEIVREAAGESGVRAIIFEAPCIAIVKPQRPLVIDEDKCTNCRACMKTIGCPSIALLEGKVNIDKDTCTGCGLCSYVCPTRAIKRADGGEGACGNV